MKQETEHLQNGFEFEFTLPTNLPKAIMEATVSFFMNATLFLFALCVFDNCFVVHNVD